MRAAGLDARLGAAAVGDVAERPVEGDDFGTERYCALSMRWPTARRCCGTTP